MGQGSIGLGQKQYYMSETPITRAYRQLMRDLVRALGNDTTNLDQDVNEAFEFERTIARVTLQQFYPFTSHTHAHIRLGPLVNRRAARARQRNGSNHRRWSRERTEHQGECLSSSAHGACSNVICLVRFHRASASGLLAGECHSPRH